MSLTPADREAIREEARQGAAEGILLVLKPLVSVAEAAEMLNRSPPTVGRWVKEGRLRPMEGSGRLAFRRTDILDAIASGLVVRGRRG